VVKSIPLECFSPLDFIDDFEIIGVTVPSISKQTTLTDPNFQRKGTIKNKSEIKGNIVQQHKTGSGFLESALYVGKEITKTAPEPLHPLTPIQGKHVTDQTVSMY
jgi:hypothetical protein